PLTVVSVVVLFLLSATPPSDTSPLSLHDALPISHPPAAGGLPLGQGPDPSVHPQKLPGGDLRGPGGHRRRRPPDAAGRAGGCADAGGLPRCVGRRTGPQHL